MSLVLDILGWAALCLGGFFCVVGAIGLHRMPDVFTRMHAASVVETLGVGFLTLGMLTQTSDWTVIVRLVIILVVLLVTGAVAGHALSPVHVFALSHGVGDQSPETKRRSARSIFLVAVVCFQDLDVHAAGNIFKGVSDDFRQLHRQIDGRAHVGGPDNGDCLSGGLDLLLLLLGQSGCRHDQRNTIFQA